MGIGDITSEERGSGARFNDGKTPFELIPVGVLVAWGAAFDTSDGEVLEVLRCMALWQARQMRMDGVLGALSKERLEDAARVFAYGARKYAAWNWAKGQPWSVPTGCLLRHAMAILGGEDIDPESQLPHWGHLACNAIMLAHFEGNYPEGDDRPPEYCFGGYDGH